MSGRTCGRRSLQACPAAESGAQHGERTSTILQRCGGTCAPLLCFGDLGVGAIWHGWCTGAGFARLMRGRFSCRASECDRQQDSSCRAAHCIGQAWTGDIRVGAPWLRPFGSSLGPRSRKCTFCLWRSEAPHLVVPHTRLKTSLLSGIVRGGASCQDTAAPTGPAVVGGVCCDGRSAAGPRPAPPRTSRHRSAVGVGTGSPACAPGDRQQWVRMRLSQPHSNTQGACRLKGCHPLHPKYDWEVSPPERHGAHGFGPRWVAAAIRTAVRGLGSPWPRCCERGETFGQCCDHGPDAQRRGAPV